MSNRMTEITAPLYEYLQENAVREPAILGRLREETHALGNIARMQIAPEQGQFMGLMMQVLQARRYLEVGTFTGYSMLSCLMAMPPDARAVACDVSKEWTDIARRYWNEAGVADRIDLKLGPATETLEAMLAEGKADAFDAIFIDADKVNYETYYELGLKLVRPGGLIMVDNVLWHGDVANPEDQDKDTVAIRNLNARIHQDERVTMSLVTMADGLTLAWRRR